MHEILSQLPPGALVLDLGCGAGSFSPDCTRAIVVRFDRDSGSIRGDAARLPFRACIFDAIVSNHSLEHFDDLDAALAEISRVIRPGGALFVAVPDASTFTDKLYRWLARGGGHVNAFTSLRHLTDLIEGATGLKLRSAKLLYSSLSFLNERNAPRPRPRRIWLVGGGTEWTLFLYTWLSRRLDRLIGTRTSVYGWALYFGTMAGSIDATPWPNVCIRCGSGAPPFILENQALVRSLFPGIRVFNCPGCGAVNPFTGPHA